MTLLMRDDVSNAGPAAIGMENQCHHNIGPGRLVSTKVMLLPRDDRVRTMYTSLGTEGNLICRPVDPIPR